MQSAKGSRSVNQIAMSVILASISIGLLVLIIPVVPFPVPGLIILTFVAIFIVSIVSILAKKFWGYPLGTVSLLILFFQFVSNIVDSLTRPSSAQADFALSLTAVIGVILSIPFGIQGFRESRRKMMSPFQASKLTALALLGFGIFVGGILTANLGAMSQGSSTVSLSGPPNTTLTLEEKNTNFAIKELTAKSGNVLVIVKNSDSSVHTFTIDELKVNTENPASRTSLAAFSADKPATYTFYCSIPGHREAGMEGKLTVQG